jgi:hypothetical protein
LDWIGSYYQIDYGGDQIGAALRPLDSSLDTSKAAAYLTAKPLLSGKL